MTARDKLIALIATAVADELERRAKHQAATTPRRLAIDFSANVPGSVRTSEVGG